MQISFLLTYFKYNFTTKCIILNITGTKYINIILYNCHYFKLPYKYL